MPMQPTLSRAAPMASVAATIGATTFVPAVTDAATTFEREARAHRDNYLCELTYGASPKMPSQSSPIATN